MVDESGGTPVLCPRCGRVIGREVVRNGLPFVQLGRAVLRSFHGVCAWCGADVHYTIQDSLMIAALRAASKPATITVTISTGAARAGETTEGNSEFTARSGS